MLSQRALLRIILFSLAVAAALGAACVLFGATDVMWRTIGTLVLVGFSSLIVLGVTTRMATPELRLASLAAMLLVGIEFLLCLSLIWDIVPVTSRSSENVGQTIAAIAGAGIPAVIFLRFIRRQNCIVAAIMGLIVCAIVFGLWMIGVGLDAGVWQANPGNASWEFYLDGYALGSMGILAAICLVGVGNDRWYGRWVGITCAVSAAAIMIYASHVKLQELPQPTNWLIAAAVIAAHANLALRCPLVGNQRWLAYITIAAVAATGIFINLMIISDPGVWYHSGRGNAEILGRLAGASAILAACGTLSLAILTRMNAKPKSAAMTSLDNLQISVICPICQRKQTLGTTGGTCAGCGLKMSVKLDPPSCSACGYSLLMLKSDRCPECGAMQSAATAPVMQ